MIRIEDRFGRFVWFVLEKKTIKTPPVTAEACGSSSCLPVLAPKSMLSSTRLETQYGLVPKLSRHGWQKHRALRWKTKRIILYTANILCFSGSSEPMFLLFSGCCHKVMYVGVAGFCLCACTQVKGYRNNIKDKVLTWKKGFCGFCCNCLESSIDLETKFWEILSAATRLILFSMRSSLQSSKILEYLVCRRRIFTWTLML